MVDIGQKHDPSYEITKQVIVWEILDKYAIDFTEAERLDITMMTKPQADFENESCPSSEEIAQFYANRKRNN